MMEITRLFDILPYYKKTYKPKDDTLAGKEKGEWTKYTIDDYIEISNNVSYALLKLGLKNGDKVATITNNRPEWNFVDMGISQIGAIHVPIYPTISESDYKYILDHAEVQVLFVSSKELLKKIQHILPDVPSLKEIYTFNQVEGTKHFSELVQIGKDNQDNSSLDQMRSAIKTEDIVTLIYTSGTTGNPKGVMLSHANIISNIAGTKHILPFGEEGKALSYLPLCHIYERMLTYLFQYTGISIYYAENMGTIADNIREIKPDVMSTVPRLLEKVYDKIIAKGRKLGTVKKNIFFWSVNIGLRYELEGKNSLWYKSQLFFARKLVLDKWKAGLGGNFKLMVSGGAALQERLGRIFTSAGIPVLEGYGLTETSPVIAVNSLEKGTWKFGTVGKPIKDAQVKITEEGEILCKGPNVMQGYYKQPELTKEAIDVDGYFHTGDIGHIDDEGYLKITGRIKEIFKTSLGKYISPALMENKFLESPFIENMVVLGENQKFAAALIVPDYEHLKNYCRVKGYEYSTNEEMSDNPVIKKRYQKEVDFYNQFFGKTEQIMRFSLMDKAFSLEEGELTAKMGVKRDVICDRYKARIEKLFS